MQCMTRILTSARELITGSYENTHSSLDASVPFPGAHRNEHSPSGGHQVKQHTGFLRHLNDASLRSYQKIQGRRTWRLFSSFADNMHCPCHGFVLCGEGPSRGAVRGVQHQGVDASSHQHRMLGHVGVVPAQQVLVKFVSECVIRRIRPILCPVRLDGSQRQHMHA